MTELNDQPAKWHESLAVVLIVAILATVAVACATAPCWGGALLLWVSKA
ncbi:hypothetical protein Drose_04510 [Dactylosporangium roseum]|uniref:Lipoprotein n=1 Tax=Dactylosporangium roseum TaxID=47989 RepID=A0ABY5Z7V4_9ACTN|nr:hypothetical protein [Dactylosporangium roseum]UWZ37552.1 hypothetical protein Drose_04510 [Dactylosporangium roseum]